MRSLVDQRFLEDSVRFVERGLSDVDQEVVVAAAEGLRALMDPHRGDRHAQCSAQSSDDERVPVGLDLGVSPE